MTYTPLTPETIRHRLLEIALSPCLCCRAADRGHLEARVRFEVEVGACSDPDACLAAMSGEALTP